VSEPGWPSAPGSASDGGDKKPRRRWRWLSIIAIGFVALVGVGAAAWAIFVEDSRPDAPGEFYAAPSPLPDGPPGTIIRSEAVDGFSSGATAHRVLYKSTGYDGRPTAVSGLIVVPDGSPPAGDRKVIAYTHGTVGVAPECAPSLVTDEAQQPLLLEGGRELLAAGYVVAASDYQGLGTPGPHPYLVGESEAMNELDIVRAARNLSEAHAGKDFVVWGHSQGGHASLFTGQLAGSYAPELRLLGVAAGAPVPNLADLFEVNIETTVGKILISMALQSWARVYDDASLDQIVSRGARPLVGRIARNCLYTRRQILSSVPGSLALDLSFLHTPPWKAEPWATILEENNPGQTRTNAPMLIVQGDADPIVAPEITARLVDKLCAAGETVDLRMLKGTAHLDAGHVAVPDVVEWIADRFADKPPPTTCT
jgi:alpha-beta hydrolase superfamily lysophospholipase